jgi:hypothetical protein
MCGAKKQERKILAEASAAAKASPERLDAIVQRLVGLSKVSNADRRKAVKLLEDIKSKDFAYRPNSLILLATALRGIDPWMQVAYERRWAGETIHRRPALSLEPLDEPGRIQKIEDELNRDFPDSMEWLKDRLIVAKSAEEVLGYRVQKAEKTDRQ